MNPKFLSALLAITACAAPSLVAVPVVVNGDFQTGNFTGWTLFTTAVGVSNSAIQVVDVDNDGNLSSAATFAVGRTSSPFTIDAPQEGGGIFQNISFADAGLYTFSADIAAFNTNATLSNAQGGSFTMLLDGAPIATLDFAGIAAGATEFGLLTSTTNVSAGVHELRFQMTRSFAAGSTRQYLDDITISGGPSVPDGGATAAMLFLALLGLMGLRRKLA